MSATAEVTATAEVSAPGAEDDVDGLALLAAIVASSEDAIVSKTLEGKVLSWNAAATRIFGYESGEIVGRPITTIIPPELQYQEGEILSKIRRGEHVEHFDTIRLTKDGRRIPISLTISPVRDAQGKIIAASKVARDISERRKVEEQLREADRRKDEFLALLAHELRNPLPAICYAIELIKRGNLTDTQRSDAQQVIERQVAHVSRLLDDLLDVSRITHGKVELRKECVKLGAIVASAVETARPLLEAKRHRLTVALPANPVYVEADAVRLAQVFSNLLINAAKFTKPGGNIQLKAVAEAGAVRISVHDDGAGISAELRPRLFTMFAQDRHSRQDGGLGVGLCLVRELVALHGGTIEARSEGTGRGSEFSVRLPIAPRLVAAVAGNPDERGGSAELRVLVVDDNQDAADSCKALLALAGHRVESAYSARRALELGEELRPQVVLLDIGLPDLSGYEVARVLRGSEWGQRAVLVAVTGWGQAQDRRRAFEAGFDWHATKPIASEDLRAFLRSVAEHGRRTPSVFGHRLMQSLPI